MTGGGEPPWEWVQLVLCRDVYHCRPSELDGEDAETVMTHLALLNTAAKVEEFKAKRHRQKRG